MRYIAYCFLTVVMLCSCTKIPSDVQKVLQAAGPNRKELRSVIKHYIALQDSLKLKAAYFLIANMEGKYSLVIDSNSLLRKSFPLLAVNDPSRMIPQSSVIGRIVDSLMMKERPKVSIQYDIDYISADYLIKNIDLAFAVWEKAAWKHHYTFDQFCEYILPYRCDNEPLSNWREEAYQKFQHLLTHSSDPVEIAKKFMLENTVTFNSGLTKFPYPLTFEEVAFINKGNCVHRTDYFTCAMRALGVPTAIDRVLNWADRSSSHQWNIVIDTTGRTIDIDFQSPNKIRFISKISKIYRKTYQKSYPELYHTREYPVFINGDIKDVTAEYDQPVSEITIPLSRKAKARYAYLCNFNNSEWVPVAIAKIHQDSVTFRDVARGIFHDRKRFRNQDEGYGLVFLVCAYQNDNMKPLSAPFILQEDGAVRHLVPDKQLLQKIEVTRKYPLYEHFFKFANRMRNGYFTCSDGNGANTRVVYRLRTPPQHTTETIVLEQPVFCREITYVSANNPKVNLAELTFYNDSIRIGGEPFGNQGMHGRGLDKAFDGNMETFYEVDADTGDSYIGMRFPDLTRITRITFSFRNDNNAISPGDYYELFYWDSDTWKSLGSQEATSFQLTFDNVPQNALLLLHNHSRGKEERPFTFENENQIWW